MLYRSQFDSCSPGPWSKVKEDATGSTKVLCRNGGVIALMKAAGGRKAANAAAVATLPVLVDTLEDMAAWDGDDCISRDDLASWMRERAQAALKAIADEMP